MLNYLRDAVQGKATSTISFMQIFNTNISLIRKFQLLLSKTKEL